MTKTKLLSTLRKIKRHLFKNGNYSSYIEVEGWEWNFYINYLEAGMTVFDVGANVGELSLLFCRFVVTV